MHDAEEMQGRIFSLQVERDSWSPTVLDSLHLIATGHRRQKYWHKHTIVIERRQSGVYLTISIYFSYV